MKAKGKKQYRVDAMDPLTGERIRTVAWFDRDYDALQYVRTFAEDPLNWKFDYHIEHEVTA